MRTNLDQVRGLIYFPINCSNCLSTGIFRGGVTGTYGCRCDNNPDAAPEKPTVRLNGQSYLIDDLAAIVQTAQAQAEGENA